MKLKVCGMREKENILALSDLRPDYIGFIFWASSSRYVNSPTPKLDKKFKKTGVFVNANVEYVQDIIITHQLQAVQLHGKETPSYCELIKEFGVEVIKSFSIKLSANGENFVFLFSVFFHRSDFRLPLKSRVFSSFGLLKS